MCDRATSAAATTGVGVVHTCVLLLFGIRRSVSKLPVHFTPKIPLWARSLLTSKCTQALLKSLLKHINFVKSSSHWLSWYSWHQLSCTSSPLGVGRSKMESIPLHWEI